MTDGSRVELWRGMKGHATAVYYFQTRSYLADSDLGAPARGYRNPRRRAPDPRAMTSPGGERERERFRQTLDGLLYFNPDEPSSAAIGAHLGGSSAPASASASAASRSANEPDARGRRVARPGDRGDFLRRLATFAPGKWFAKPPILSPVPCARKGWECVAVDALRCEACLARVIVRAPPDATREQLLEIAVKQAGKLDDAHEESCAWRGAIGSIAGGASPSVPVGGSAFGSGGGFAFGVGAATSTPFGAPPASAGAAAAAAAAPARVADSSPIRPFGAALTAAGVDASAGKRKRGAGGDEAEDKTAAEPEPTPTPTPTPPPSVPGAMHPLRQHRAHCAWATVNADTFSGGLGAGAVAGVRPGWARA
ncbi:LOW QUALITY PROTEIN: uncharacterized protein MICPUCDRAFT_66422 [Micromonas pusilla CCMP1545]|uniref:Predicted protein n=1 Tax=Micromonas pusilla (strain CCMP1545) TaxID=564608 RepID=C1N8M1_MICPC|nr:LOW QUALITY PROTEIN: uncharacterized protein MICPUCDRAFT_66422 [Micromonas pusilla CCMP1545]EEH51730.1 predicted protein [Micromonas pusilla CCMP1545]|eukprot:XP_003064108.1 predicted protein [Micromonas pusilla CCMP1545]